MARFDFAAKYGYSALEATQRNAADVARMGEKQALHDSRQTTPGKLLSVSIAYERPGFRDWMRMTGRAAQHRAVRMVS